MKQLFFLLVGVFFLPLLSIGQPAWTPEDILEFKEIGKVAIASRGERIVYEVWHNVISDKESSKKSHLYIYEYGENKPFATGDFSYENPCWSPDGEYVLLSSKRDDTYFLWLQELQSGRGRVLSELPNAPSHVKYAPNGSQIAYIGRAALSDEEVLREESGDDVKQPGIYPAQHIWIVDIATAEVKQLTDGDFSVGARNGNLFDWSPDSREIVFAHTPSSVYNDWQKSDLSIVDVSSGEVRPLVNTAFAESDPYFSPDGNWIGFRVNDAPEKWIPKARAHVIQVDGKGKKELAKTVDENISLIGWSPDGFSLLAEEPYRTMNRLVHIPTSGRNPVYYEDSSPARLMGKPYLSQDRQWIGFTMESNDQPEELFLTRLTTFKPDQISSVQPPNSGSYGHTEVLEWESHDGMVVEGLLSYPIGYKPGESPVPLLVLRRGSPAGAARQGFAGAGSPYPVALLTAQGYAVLQANFRGSEGYGIEFRSANYEDLGGKDYEDIMSGVDFLIAEGIADSARLGIIGWNYGGYMASWAISQTDRFRVAINGAGLTNLVSFSSLSDMPNYTVGYLGGELWEIQDLLVERSPLFQIGAIHTPTLILHGEEDKCIPIEQSLEFYNGLMRKKIPSEMYLYPRQAHELSDPTHVLHAMEKVLYWLERWL